MVLALALSGLAYRRLNVARPGAPANDGFGAPDAPADATTAATDDSLDLATGAFAPSAPLRGGGAPHHDIPWVRSVIHHPAYSVVGILGLVGLMAFVIPRLATILGTACLLVFAVGLFLFRDLKAAGLVLLVAILGPAGGSLALYLTGTPLNVGSYTGLIMVVGIIGENAIFTFQQFNDFRAEGGPVEAAIGYAIAARLRPKLMTALAVIAALLPLALGIGAGARLHQPLAIAVIGGLLLALPLLLVVLPSLLRLAYGGGQEAVTN